MQQKRFSENCMVCGSELEHLELGADGTCIYCGAREHTYFRCPEGHYVCNQCHSKEALIKITNYCLNTDSTNPMAMLEDLMADSSVAMHGPEHHAMVPAVLTTAYRNATGGKVQETDILEAIRRGSKVPGGYCGIYGACGAGIGAGVSVAVVTGSTPLKGEPRALSNLMTARTLAAIAEQGGARCCKACSRIAVQTAIDFFQRHLDCTLQMGDTPWCSYMKRNAQCNLSRCKYFPQKKSDFTSGNG